MIADNALFVLSFLALAIPGDALAILDSRATKVGKTKKKGKVTGGAIAGIIIAAVVILVIAAIIFLILRRRKAKQQKLVGGPQPGYQQGYQ